MVPVAEVRPDRSFKFPDIVPLFSYCRRAEMQGVFLPELAKEVADGLLTGFMILL